MRQLTTVGPVALLAALAAFAALAAGACGGERGDRAESGDTMTAAGEVSPGGTVGSMGALADSDATAEAGTTVLATLGAPDVLAVIGAANAAEIATSRAVLARLTRDEVRAYARRMIEAHQAMQEQADQLATRLAITPGNPAPAVDRTRRANEATRQLRSTARGEALDRQYVDGQVLAHQQTLAQLEAMRRTGDAEVRALVQQAIPRVQAHLREAQRLQRRLGGAAGDSAERR